MAPISKAALIALAQSKIPGGSRTSATEMKEVINALVESLVGLLDDAGVEDGFPALDGAIKISASVLPLKAGRTALNGNGAMVDFVIPHGYSAVPSKVLITPHTPDAAEKCWVESVDATDITVKFSVAPPVGVSNVEFSWLVF